jgi:hypothetical protein
VRACIIYVEKDDLIENPPMLFSADTSSQIVAPSSRAASPAHAQPDPTTSAPSPNADRDPQLVHQGDIQHGSSKDNKGVILGNALNSNIAGMFLNKIIARHRTYINIFRNCL